LKTVAIRMSTVHNRIFRQNLRAGSAAAVSDCIREL
jgi:hypothetical protein